MNKNQAIAWSSGEHWYFNGRLIQSFIELYEIDNPIQSYDTFKYFRMLGP